MPSSGGFRSPYPVYLAGGLSTKGRYLAAAVRRRLMRAVFYCSCWKRRFFCAFRCFCGGCPARRNTEIQREITGLCVRKSGGGNLRHGFREDTENGKCGSRKGESGSRRYSGKLTGTASGMADMDFLQSAYFLVLAADFSRLLSVGVCL